MRGSFLRLPVPVLAGVQGKLAEPVRVGAPSAERVQVRLYDNGDGTYTARLADDLSYGATITGDMIDDGNAEVIRIVLIVILTVLALVILGVYLYLLPWEKYRKNKK